MLYVCEQVGRSRPGPKCWLVSLSFHLSSGCLPGNDASDSLIFGFDKTRVVHPDHGRGDQGAKEQKQIRQHAQEMSEVLGPEKEPRGEQEDAPPPQWRDRSGEGGLRGQEGSRVIFSRPPGGGRCGQHPPASVQPWLRESSFPSSCLASWNNRRFSSVRRAH